MSRIYCLFKKKLRCSIVIKKDQNAKNDKSNICTYSNINTTSIRGNQYLQLTLYMVIKKNNMPRAVSGSQNMLKAVIGKKKLPGVLQKPDPG